jgi:hypothetical protein
MGMLWNTIELDLPSLIAQLEKILPGYNPFVDTGSKNSFFESGSIRF